MAKISVLGAGSWGTALAVVLHKNGHEVTIWSISEDEIAMLKKEREHKDKLPGVKIPEQIGLTADLKEAIAGRDMLVVAVPSPYIRSTAKSMAPYVGEGQLLVSVAKGIEEGTLMTLSAILKQEIPQSEVAVLCGPPIMIKFTLAGLQELGFDKTQVYTTLELRMKCGIGKCGRCNVGAKYVCKDGPVFRCDELDELPSEY